MAPIFIKRYGGNNNDEVIGKYNELYGFTIDQTNDEVVISYIGDNQNYTPAYMDFNSGIFNYGSWGDAFFMKNARPCIVFNTGGVYRYLDKNNFYKDINGGDYKRVVEGYEGHSTMIEFPKIYWKVEHIQKHVDKVWISDGKADRDFECYANINIYGEKISKFYVSAFESIINYNDDIVSCADSGAYLIGTYTNAKVNTFQKVENKLSVKSGTPDRIWTMLKCCDKAIIDFLLILISKSIDCQASFGGGNVSGFKSGVSGKNAVRPGSMISNGMFMGYDLKSGKGVKVFGIENYWGNTYKLVRCFSFYKNDVYIKMIESELTKDTSTGAGEIDYDYKFNTGDVAGMKFMTASMIKKMHVGVFGFFPEETAGSSSPICFKDGIYFIDFSNCSAGDVHGIKITGGRNDSGDYAGINFINNTARTGRTFDYNFLMSLKPRASVVNA